MNTTIVADHVSVLSSRDKYDDRGYPTRWTISKQNPGGHFETQYVTFKRFDLDPTFNDETAFKPVYPPDFVVSDMSTGRGVFLQKPPS